MSCFKHTFTFVATFESILAAGATPILVEIDDTLTLDPKAVEAAITSKTKGEDFDQKVF